MGRSPRAKIAKNVVRDPVGQLARVWSVREQAADRADDRVDGPPRLGKLSTSKTFRPSLAASIAAETPEIPAPTTQMSAATLAAGESLGLILTRVGKLVEPW
jgi:hypothetical protein